MAQNNKKIIRGDMDMGLFDKIKKFIQDQYTLTQKDDVLFVAIHEILTEELGWKTIKFKMKGDEHEAEYVNPNSPIQKLEIEAKRHGSRFYLELEAESFHGEVMEDIFEKLVGFDVDFDKKLKVYWKLDEFVDGSLTLIDEDKLRQKVYDLIQRLESMIR